MGTKVIHYYRIVNCDAIKVAKTLKMNENIVPNNPRHREISENREPRTYNMPYHALINAALTLPRIQL